MKNHTSFFIKPTDTLSFAIQVIDKNAAQLAVVVSNDSRLLGVLTDGDVRRALIDGKSLDVTVDRVMNKSPLFGRVGISNEEALLLMKKHVIHQLPIVDDNQIVINVLTIDGLIAAQDKDNRVILMAGGLGMRLRPLTDNCPKPMLKVGGKPILEHLIESFSQQGFRNFYISVNYRAEYIESYFGDGSKWGVSINYLHEEQKMGTAGSLSLLPQKLTAPFFVMNGDLLTKADFLEILSAHEKAEADATIVVREHESQIPYGVVEVDKFRVLQIIEKPIKKFYVNTGIYLINPSVLEGVKKEFIDMPDLLQGLIKTHKVVNFYDLKEYWLDIGRHEEFEKAQSDWVRH